MAGNPDTYPQLVDVTSTAVVPLLTKKYRVPPRVKTTLVLCDTVPKIQRRVATHPLIAAVDESVAGGTELYTLIRQASAYYYGLLRPLRVVRRNMQCRFVPKKQYTALL